jgi:hypothetical protein
MYRKTINMKKLLLVLMACVYSINVDAQLFKKIYDNVFKYSSIYAAGNTSNSFESTRKEYFVRPPADGNVYDIPQIADVTNYFPNDYRLGIGIRKLARFGYENKPNFYNGTENNIALSAPTAAVQGFEYLFHYEKERQRGDEFVNSRYFLRHTGKYHILKAEQREAGNVGFKYQSAEARLRLPITNKFSVSAGAIYRTHEQAFGYNPIEIWLNETEIIETPDGPFEIPSNPWFTLGYLYGYTDHPVTYTDEQTGEQGFDWVWRDPEGNIVAYTDIDFRNTVFMDLINRYNNEIWDTLSSFGEIAPIVGFDFYHYKNNFWLHAYGNVILPYHKYLKGNVDFSFLNRNNWGKGGLRQDAELQQWQDLQGGIMFGWRIWKSVGLFAEAEYVKFWDREIFNTNFGINLTMK